MSASGKSLLGLWLYRSGEQEWAVKAGSPIHKPKDLIVNINQAMMQIPSIASVYALNRQKEEPESESQLPTNDRTSIIFTLKDQVGALAKALQVFQELGMNVLHIELHSGNESEMVSNEERNFHSFTSHKQTTLRSLRNSPSALLTHSCPGRRSRRH